MKFTKEQAEALANAMFWERRCLQLNEDMEELSRLRKYASSELSKAIQRLRDLGISKEDFL